MTGSHPGTPETGVPETDIPDAATRPISVAELLARSGNIGSPPVTGRRRRRRGNADAVTVAELTGEIPIIRDDQPAPTRDARAGAQHPEKPVNRQRPPTEPEPVRRTGEIGTVGWSEPGARWPRSMPSARDSGPEPSHYPRPVRRSDLSAPDRAADARRWGPGAGAEQMSPDPVDKHVEAGRDAPPLGAGGTASPAEAAETTDRGAEAPSQHRARRRIFGRRRTDGDGADPAASDSDSGTDTDVDDLAGLAALETERPVEIDDDHTDIEEDLAGEPVTPRGRWSEMLSGLLVVVQSVLAVAFGGGLFVAFDQLWRWNSIVALVLTVLVTLGLVAAVQAVRKTVDIGSTLTAVAVGLLVTLGPLALHAN